MKNPYFPTALGLYFNYLVHGMGVILMSLNMASLETLWQTNAAGVSIVISSLGIGRLSVLLFAGLLSDRFGRRPFIMLGMCCYMAFWICPYISRHLLSLNPLLARCRRYSRG
ncbi:MFS transporter, partial [Escherichia coli]|uniref:MFS transporter n=4 Tax=Escherichia coli TaxID=562 RepID=UPI00208DA307